MNLQKFEKSKTRAEISQMFNIANALRTDQKQPIDVSLFDIAKQNYNLSREELLEDLGIDFSVDTIQNLMGSGDFNVRWLIPEIYRDAIRAGYRKAPIWPSITAIEEGTTGLTQIMPQVNMSDSAPKRVGEAETIPLGSLSYGSKSFKIFKVGRGIKIPYEVVQYVNLNVVNIFLEDFGVKMGQAMDVLALDTLINGEQADGSEAAAIIGVGQTGTDNKVYKDFLRVWVRMSRIARVPSVIVGGEDAAIATLDLDEFKKRELGTPMKTLDLQTPLPSTSKYFIHGNVPTDQEIIIDPTRALAKFNAQPLLVESEKIVSNQTEAFYASLTTGFAKLFRDAAIILDASKAWSTYNFNHASNKFLDLDAAQNVMID